MEPISEDLLTAAAVQLEILSLFRFTPDEENRLIRNLKTQVTLKKNPLWTAENAYSFCSKKFLLPAFPFLVFGWALAGLWIMVSSKARKICQSLCPDVVDCPDGLHSTDG